MHIGAAPVTSVFGASGVQNFASREVNTGWWWHRLFGPMKPDFTGVTLVTKTTTLHFQPGNMPLDENDQPVELLPECIAVDRRGKHVVNAVGLSGPGARALFSHGGWQDRLRAGETVVISFMSTENSPLGRRVEWSDFLWLLVDNVHQEFFPQVIIQKNYSCPNTSLNVGDYGGLVEEIGFDALILAERTNAAVSFMPKFSVTTPPEVAGKCAELPYVDAVCSTNTVKWGTNIGWLQEADLDALQIPWEHVAKAFGTQGSPLGDLMGGYSGPHLLDINLEWVRRFRAVNRTTHLNAGGGIFHPRDAIAYLNAGADSVFIGSCAIVRPWRVRNITRRVERYKAGASRSVRDILSDRVNDAVRFIITRS